MPEDQDYSLLVPFLNADPVFCQGVQFGMLAQRMLDKEPDIREYILSEIEEQVRVAASRLGYEIVELRSWEHEGQEAGWVFVRMYLREIAA